MYIETITLKTRAQKINDPSKWPIAYTLNQIGGTGKGRFLCAIKFNINRFSQLMDQLHISGNKLSKELKAPELNGMSRNSFPVVPRLEYYLTKWGEPVFSVIRLMGDWGENYIHNEKLNDHPIFKNGIYNCKKRTIEYFSFP